jgi:hypothetical protein
MRIFAGLIGACLYSSLLATAVPVDAQRSARNANDEVCPRGYSLVLGLCVGDETGDVVLPAESKPAKK